MKTGLFGGNAKYNGFGKPCQTLQTRFYARTVGRQGAKTGKFLEISRHRRAVNLGESNPL